MLKVVVAAKRLVFPIACVLSFLLCVGMAGLWVRSYWINDEAFVIYTVDGFEQLLLRA